MFGLGAPELIILIAIIVGVVAIAKTAGKSSRATPGNLRKCLVCDYQGTMKTWLGNYSLPQLIAIIGLLFYFLPGIIFIAWAWGKRKCPNCGALAKNVPFAEPAMVEAINDDTTTQTKRCPYCAEEIKIEAIKCRFCGSDL